jgi:uncharacterized protein (TIGR04255 family)
MAYKRPPITEAVIELRFTRTFAQKTIEEVAKRLRGDYFYHDPEQMIQFTIEPATETTQRQTAWTGVKLSSPDRADVLMFRTNSFACSRLAPYMGWDAFRERANRGWSEWKRVAGPVELTRIGVRYINRIDIPIPTQDDKPLIRIEDYLSLRPHLPVELTEPMTSYAMQVVLPLDEGRYAVVLNSSIVPSPLAGFASLVLDLDLSRERDLPKRDDAIWQVLDDMRVHKNRIFEYCITDRSRSLFVQ